MEILVPKNIYESDISGKGLVAYIFTKSKLLSMPHDEVFISPYDIALYIEDLTAPCVKRIGEGLEEVYNNQLFDMEKVGKFKYIVRNYEAEEDFFAVIRLEHIIKIFKKEENARYKFNKARYDIAKYYVNLMGLRLNKQRVCNLSLEELSQKTLYNINCIERYNDYLERNRIVYIYRNYIWEDKNRTNLYGMYEDKEYVDAFARAHKYNKLNKERSSWRRSVARKYNYFLKNPNKYTDEEKWELRRELEKYNKEMDELQKMYAGSEYIKRKKDISVFNS